MSIQNSIKPFAPAPLDPADFIPIFDEIATGAAKRDRERILPFEEIDLLRQSRFGAYRLPRNLGGAGASFRELFGRIIELGEADSNVAHILRNHFVFVERFVRHAATPQAFFWRDKVAGGAIFGLANTEKAKAENGGDSVTRLSVTPGGYRLDGTKFYSTGSLYSDFIIVRAKDEADAQVTVIIPTDRPGVTLDDDWDAAGQRLTGTGTTHFKDVHVEATEVVFDGKGSPYDVPYSSTLPQLFLTVVNAGILRAVLRDAKALIGQREKKAFYHAPSDIPANDPLLLKIIGDLASQAYAAEAVVLAAADAQDRLLEAFPSAQRLYPAAHQASLEAAKAKVVVDGLTMQAATALFDVGGASSTQRLHNLDRHWRNARTLSSHNPAHYKAYAIGDFELNGKPLPTAGNF